MKALLYLTRLPSSASQLSLSVLSTPRLGLEALHAPRLGIFALHAPRLGHVALDIVATCASRLRYYVNMNMIVISRLGGLHAEFVHKEVS